GEGRLVAEEQAHAGDVLAPGVSAPAVQVLVRTGRVGAAVDDEQQSGLANIGTDWIPQAALPSRRVYVPGIVNGTGPRVLSIAAPGGDDAIVNVRVITADGTYAPAERSQINVPADSVVTLDMAPILKKKPATLELTSDTPIVTGGNQIMPRSTMPARGLRDTAPFHWDGIPGDPYGGINSASIHKPVPANSNPKDQRTSTRNLVDGGLASTMALPGDNTTNAEGKKGRLQASQRDDMALYLLGVPYPPAPGRPYTDLVSRAALEGFRLFHIDGDNDPKQAKPNVCGNCHRMPFLVSTNTPGTGMDTPTFRGAQDRWLILPQGRLNIIAFDFYRKVAEAGHPERELWRHAWAQRSRFDPVWDMVLEMSTGFSGAFARQVQIDRATSTNPGATRLIGALEKAAREGTIVLQCDGFIRQPQSATDLRLQFDPTRGDHGEYIVLSGDIPQGNHPLTRARLLELAANGSFTGSLTARHGAAANMDSPQPALWTRGPIERQRGRQVFPILHPDDKTMPLSGRHFDASARILIDGTQVPGSLRTSTDEAVDLVLENLPFPGMHLVQIQMPGGM
ncbi:MAG: DUF5719 family protein, partial [Gemmataceae bacterium]